VNKYCIKLNRKYACARKKETSQEKVEFFFLFLIKDLIKLNIKIILLEKVGNRNQNAKWFQYFKIILSRIQNTRSFK